MSDTVQDLLGAAPPAEPKRRRSAMHGQLGHERIAGDAYFTIDEWVTQALVDAVKFRDGIWEPACGAGHMARVLTRAGYDVASTDLVDHGFGIPGQDFLKAEAQVCRAIVTNPPYGDDAEAFVRHALRLTEAHSGQVAMLLRHEWDCAAGRRDLFDGPPFAMRLTLTRRPRWFEPQPGEKAEAPRFNFAWFVWDWTHTGPAIAGYGP